MNTLAEFLLARIAEDEALARPGVTGYVGDPWALFAWGHEIDVNFPRVLAECDAKRRILGLWNLQLSVAEPEYGLAGGEPLGGQGAEVYYDALKALALPYASHPDYREEWRP